MDAAAKQQVMGALDEINKLLKQLTKCKNDITAEEKKT